MGCAKSSLFRSNSQSRSHKSIVHISKTGLHISEINQVVRVFKTEKLIESTFLIEIWWEMLTPKFLNLLENYLLFEFGRKWNQDKTIEVSSLGFLLRDLTRGTDEELVNYFMKLYEHGCPDDTIHYYDLKQFARDLILSSLRLMKVRKTLPYVMWTEKGSTFDLDSVKRWVNHSMIPLKKFAEKEFIQSEDVRVWINFNRPLLQLLSYLARGLFFIDVQRNGDTEEIWPVYPPLPELDLSCYQDEYDFPFLFDLVAVMFMNAQVPPKNRVKWKLMFSADIHGNNFSKFYQAIQSARSTMLVVKGRDAKNVFGGYASKKWKMGPDFADDEQCFLFQLLPDMHVYRSSGINGNHMYLNNFQKTYPNGLGMGGQTGYWGMWIDAGFEHGSCSGSCSTFEGYQRLSATERFRLDNLEVWGLDEKYVAEEETEGQNAGRSILTKDPTASAMLQMLGKTGEGRSFLDMGSSKRRK